MSCGEKGGHKPFVKLVNDLQVHVRGRPHVLVHQVQRRMRNELVQVAVVIFLLVGKCMLGIRIRDESHLVSGNIDGETDDNMVIKTAERSLRMVCPD